MSTNSQFHEIEQGLDTQTPLQCNLMQNGGQSAYLERLVIRHRDGVRSGRFTLQDHVAARLPHKDIADSTKSSQQIVTSKVTRQFHAASRIRSSSRCSRIRPGFRGESAKWQLTASFTISSSSSQESPWVTITPSGRRQFAVKPPSSAGRTWKTNSRSFMP